MSGIQIWGLQYASILHSFFFCFLTRMILDDLAYPPWIEHLHLSAKNFTSGPGATISRRAAWVTMDTQEASLARCGNEAGNMWRFPARHGATPIAGWFWLGRIQLKWMIWGYHYFGKERISTKLLYIYIYIYIDLS